MKRKYFPLTVFLLLPVIFLSCSDDPSDYLNDGIKDFESGDYDSAITNLRKAKYLMPESFDANLYLGESFLKNPTAKDAEYKARYYLHAAQELAKTSEQRFRISISLLNIYEKQKDYYKIVRECKILLDKDQKLLDKKKTYDLYMLRADSYFNLEEYREASEDYEYIVAIYAEELAQNPEVMAKTYLQLAASLMRTDKDRSGEALSYARKSAENEKDTFSDEYKIVAAKCYIITADHLKGKKSYVPARVCYVRAKGYFDNMGDKENSDEVLRKIELVNAHINKTCETFTCLMNKGEAQMAEKNYDDAANYFEDAEQKARTNPEKADAIAKSGIAYFLEGKEKDALSKFNILKSEYSKDYKKSKDKGQIDLFMGASIILTTKYPDSMYTKLKGFLPGNKKEGDSTFAENINSARNLILSATHDINKNTPAVFVRMAAGVCERVGERFQDWDRVGDAKQFYEKATDYYKQLLNKEKVVALTRRLREMN
jgi:tetratricopeptide (TPR) repeat protein